ncbi:Ig-like domain repeat protein, partial [Methanobrevibacter sp.]
MMCLLAKLAMSASFASDDINNIQTNTTEILSTDNMEIQSSAGDMESQAEENQISAVGSGADDVSDKESQTDKNQISSDDLNNIKSQNDEKLSAVNDGSEDVLGDEGNFEELGTQISGIIRTGSGDRTLILDKDYVYTDSDVSKSFSLIYDRIITIDGGNHTIDFKNKVSPFSFVYSSSDSAYYTLYFKFKNIHFKNVYSDVFSIGYSGTIKRGISLNFEIINCTFSNDNYTNGAYVNEHALIRITSDTNNIFNLKLEGCEFYNLSGKAGRVLFVAGGNVDVNITGCSFSNISADVDSNVDGVICARFSFNNLYISNSNFENVSTKTPGSTQDGGIIHAIFRYSNHALTVTNSTFVNCKSNGYGGVLYFNRPRTNSGSLNVNVVIDNSTFINNHADKSGGVMFFNSDHEGYGDFLIFGYDITIKNHCSFINNSAGMEGGVISYKMNNLYKERDKANFGITIENGCSFINNHADSNGGIISISGNNYYTKLTDTIKISDNCSFENNYVAKGNGGVINLYTHGVVEINNASFVNNYVLNSPQTTSTNNYGGGVIYISGTTDIASNLNISDSYFSKNHLYGGNLVGGAININQNTRTNIEDTVFSAGSINYGTGSAIHFNGDGNNVFTNVTFENNVATSKYSYYGYVGGTVSIKSNSNTIFEDCKFINNTVDSSTGRGGAVYLMDNANGNIDFKNTEFINNSATNGGALYVGYKWYNTEITGSKFINNSADEYGGAAYVSRAGLIIDSSDFSENDAKSGGALYADDSTIEVNNSDFEKNGAVRTGGAIYLYGGSTADINNTNFKNNSAENIYGGAIFAGIGSDTTIDHSIFTYNSAYKGSAINYQAETGVESSHSISNSKFTDNNANSTQLILSADAVKNTLEIIYSGGNNYIDAIKSYDNVEFRNVTYHSYDEGIITTVDGSDLEHTYTVSKQLIHLEFLDENNNTLYTKDVWTDENGRNLTDIPLDSNIKFIRAYRDNDPYYKSFYADVEIGLGDFDFLQMKVLTTAEGGTVYLDRNYIYTLNFDTITEGIEITKPITIDGCGFTIDALYQSRVFKILTNDVKFINITFVNSTNWNGSFIYGVNVTNIEIDYCRFENPNKSDTTSDSESEYLDPDDDRISLSSGTCDGGAVYIVGNDTLTNNSEFINLIGLHGGAMYLEGTNHKIANSYFNHTRAAFAGGAVFMIGQYCEILNSVFENCFADDGDIDGYDVDYYIVKRRQVNVEPAPSFPDLPITKSISIGNDILMGGMDLVDSGLVVIGDEISDAEIPFIQRGGGAVYFEGDTLKIYNSNFTNCTTKSFGGAVYSDGLNTNISYSNFNLSKALSGGAVFLDLSAEQSSIEHSFFSNNTADANGGAITWYAPRGTLSDSQFMDNTQRAENPNLLNGGGAVYWFGNDALISNSNFTNNRVSFPFENEYYPWYGDPYLSYDDLVYQDLIDDLMGRYSKGGALLIRGYSIHIVDSLFKQNYAQSGGAIAVEFYKFINENAGPIVGPVIDVPITRGLDMPGVSLLGGDLEEFNPIGEDIYPPYVVLVENTKFIDNFAQFGGAVSVEYEEIIQTEETPDTNENALNTEQTVNDIYNNYDGEMSIFVNCEFYNNTAYLAGALYLNADHCMVEKSIFEDNTAFIGGAIFNGGVGPIEREMWDEFSGEFYTMDVTGFITGNNNIISNSTFKHNYANYAGAVYWLGNNGQIGENSYFIENGYADSYARYAEDLYNCYAIEITPESYYNDIYRSIGTDEETGVSQVLISIQGMPNAFYEGFGGAIAWYGGNGKIEYSEFIQNYALNGGAIFACDLYGLSNENEDSFIEITGCFFKNNSAVTGGAISVYDATGRIQDSKFINNNASLEVERASEYSFIDSLYHENDGGAIFWSGLSLDISGSDFINNSAKNGGAISIRADEDGYGEESKISTCIFVNNTAFNGGAIYNEADSVTISGQFENNTAEANGGAIYNTGKSLHVYNSEFVFNKADTGSAIFDVADKMLISDTSFISNKAGASSIMISNEVEGNTVRINAIFKGNDNLMNALYVVNMPYLMKVDYWGADGLTNTDDHYPSISSPEAGINITFELISTEDPSISYNPQLTTNWAGNAVAVIPNVRSGRYYAIVSHFDDLYYTESNAFAMINVGKVESPIQIEIEDIFYRQNASATIKLNRDVTGNVTVQIDGENYTTVDLTGKYGLITLEDISGLEAGVHNITAIYSGDVQYDASSKTVKFTVMQIPSTVNITTDGGDYKSNITINITVESDAAGKVIVTIEDEFGATIIINNTNELQTIVNTLNEGTYNVTVHYLGDNNYLPSNNQTTLVVNPIDLNPVVTATDVTIAENTTFTITVPDDFVGNVKITVDSITQIYEIAGSTQITFVNLNAGNKSANVTFYGDKNYNEANVYPVNFTVTENQIITPVYTITVDIPDTTYKYNTTAVVNVSNNMYGSAVIFIGDNMIPVNIVNGTGSVNITGLSAGIKTAIVNFTSADNRINLTAATKFAIDKAQSCIDISIDGTTVKVNVTDGATGTVDVYINGVKEVFGYNGTVIVCENTLIIGNNTIVAVYEGNVNYTESQNDKEVSIPKKSSYVNVTADPITYGRGAVIIVCVGEGQTGHVTITINNQNYTSEIKNGGATFTVSGLNATNYPVTVKYSGDEEFESKINDTVLTVNKADLNANVIGQNVTVAENTSFIISNIADSFKGSVNITVDGAVYSGDVKSLITMAKLTAGPKTADVVFYGDNNYNVLALPVDFTVSKLPEREVIVTVNVNDVVYPNPAIAIINVSGNANGTVIVTVNGKEYAAESVTNGQATVDLGVLSAGIKNITAKFIVSPQDLANSNATGANKFVVNKAESKVELTTEDRNIIINVIGGAGKVMLYINGAKQEINFTGSVITLTNALNVGNNTILAIYEGNDNYTGSQNSTEKTIHKNRALVTVTADPITYGGDAVIIVGVGEGQTGHVTITLNNQNYTSQIKNGGATFTVSGLNVTNYPVTVKYSGDEAFESEINNTVLTVNKADLNANVIGQNITVLDNSAFFITYPSDFTGKVKITVDGLVYDGEVKSLIKMDKLTSGEKTAQVLFYGDDNYKNASMAANFKVSEIPDSGNGSIIYDGNGTLNISTVNAENMTRGYNSPYDYQAAFLDKNGSALANVEVEFRVNGNTYKVKTNDDGIAQLTSSKLPIGKYNITSVNLATGEQVTASLEIVKRITQNKDMTMDYIDGSVFKVKVFGDDGKIAPAGEIIDITANGVHYVAKVDKNGYASLKITLLPKTYKITAEYKGFKTTNKLVVKQTLKAVKKTTKVKKGKKFVLKAK